DLVCFSPARDESLLAARASGHGRARWAQDNSITCGMDRHAGGAVRLAPPSTALDQPDGARASQRAAAPSGISGRRSGPGATASLRSRRRLMRRIDPVDVGTERGGTQAASDHSSLSAPDAARLGASDGAYLSVVVPVWNGADHLSRTLYALHRLLVRQGYPTELIIVDDCSDQEVAKAIALFREDVGSERAVVRVLRNERNRGKGFSVARGMLSA